MQYIDGFEQKIDSNTDRNKQRRTVLLTKCNKKKNFGFTIQTYGIKKLNKDAKIKDDAKIYMITYIDYVEYESPAFYSGLNKGDVILSINGMPMEETSHEELVKYISSQNVLRMVVLFEDCSRKIELYLRYFKLKEILGAKIKEFRSLECREIEIDKQLSPSSRVNHVQNITNHSHTSFGGRLDHKGIPSEYAGEFSQDHTRGLHQHPFESELHPFNDDINQCLTSLNDGRYLKTPLGGNPPDPGHLLTADAKKQQSSWNHLHPATITPSSHHQSKHGGEINKPKPLHKNTALSSTELRALPRLPINSENSKFLKSSASSSSVLPFLPTPSDVKNSKPASGGDGHCNIDSKEAVIFNEATNHSNSNHQFMKSGKGQNPRRKQNGGGASGNLNPPGGHLLHLHVPVDNNNNNFKASTPRHKHKKRQSEGGAGKICTNLSSNNSFDETRKMVIDPVSKHVTDKALVGGIRYSPFKKLVFSNSKARKSVPCILLPSSSPSPHVSFSPADTTLGGSEADQSITKTENDRGDVSRTLSTTTKFRARNCRSFSTFATSFFFGISINNNKESSGRFITNKVVEDQTMTSTTNPNIFGKKQIPSKEFREETKDYHNHNLLPPSHYYPPPSGPGHLYEQNISVLNNTSPSFYRDKSLLLQSSKRDSKPNKTLRFTRSTTDISNHDFLEESSSKSSNLYAFHDRNHKSHILNDIDSKVVNDRNDDVDATTTSSDLEDFIRIGHPEENSFFQDVLTDVFGKAFASLKEKITQKDSQNSQSNDGGNKEIYETHTLNPMGCSNNHYEKQQILDSNDFGGNSDDNCDNLCNNRLSMLSHYSSESCIYLNDVPNNRCYPRSKKIDTFLRIKSYENLLHPQSSIILEEQSPLGLFFNQHLECTRL